MKKIIWIMVISFGLPVFFSILLFMQIMSAFDTEGVLKSAEYISGEQTAIHNSIQEIMMPYYTDLREELAEQRQITRNTYVQVIYPEPETEGMEDSTEILEEPDPIIIWPTVMRRVNYIPENVIIAYLLMKDGIETETAGINEWQLMTFINQISQIQESTSLNDDMTITYWVENRLLTINEIANLCFENDSDKEKFFIMCEAYGEYFDIMNPTVILEDDSEITVATTMESLSNVPLYLQYDAAWKDVPYGSGTIGKSGCCPTCLAMVFSYFQGRNVYPTEVVAWAGNKYYVTGAGTAWTIFEPAAAHWNVGCSNIGKNTDKMLEALRQGKLVVASMGPGTFTKGGHFIVLTGITESGKIKVNDPNDSRMKNHIGMEFAVSLIIRECKNMWIFG